MRKYLLNQLFKEAKRRGIMAGTIAEMKAAILNMKVMVQHLVEHHELEWEQEARAELLRLEQLLAQGQVQAEFERARLRAEAKIARQSTPKERFKRFVGATLALKQRPDLIQSAVVIKVGKRYSVYTMAKTVLLAIDLTAPQLATLKAMAKYHFKINWIGDLPTNRQKKAPSVAQSAIATGDGHRHDGAEPYSDLL